MWQGRAEAARREIAALATTGTEVTMLHAAALTLLRSAVPFDQACWASLDPAGLVMTSVTNEPTWLVGPELEVRFATSEYSGREPHSFAELARRPVPVGRASDLPHRAVLRSVRLGELLPSLGFAHELRAAFRVDGACWGAGGLFRGPGPDFTDRELEFLSAVGPTVAAATRIAVRSRPSGQREDPGPVIVVADRTGQLRAATAGAVTWLALLEDTAVGQFRLTLHAVVAAARIAATGTASARMPDPRGGWVALQASRLITGDDPEQMVITVEPVTGGRLVDLMATAYGLSRREQEVCLEVLAGFSTTGIATRLFLSPHTVQDHLKAVFHKLGVRSRGELVARLRPEN